MHSDIQASNKIACHTEGKGNMKNIYIFSSSGTISVSLWRSCISTVAPLLNRGDLGGERELVGCWEQSRGSDRDILGGERDRHTSTPGMKPKPHTDETSGEDCTQYQTRIRYRQQDEGRNATQENRKELHHKRHHKVMF